MKNKEFLETGEIVSTHGINGEIRVNPWCDSPDFLTKFDRLYFNEGNDEFKITNARVHKNIVIMKIEGIDDIDSAQKLRGKIIYINRNSINLPEGSYFIQDIIGLNVLDADDNNIVYGKIIDVGQTGANDIYYIKNNKGSQYIIPAIPDVIVNTDMENEIMYIKPLKGLFDNAD